MPAKKSPSGRKEIFPNIHMMTYNSKHTKESHLACKPFLCSKVLQYILFINSWKTFMLFQTPIISTIQVLSQFIFKAVAEESHPFAISMVLTSISGFKQIGLYLHTRCILFYNNILQDNYIHGYPFRKENVTWLKTHKELDSTPRTLSSKVSTNHSKKHFAFYTSLVVSYTYTFQPLKMEFIKNLV